MTELLQQVLTDVSARSEVGVKRAAIQAASDFVPWDGSE
jgi:hypothetical protein